MDDPTPSQRDSRRKPSQSDVRKHVSPLQTFGKTAIVILIIAVVVYMYQVC
jgi:hypothetical protein